MSSTTLLSVWREFDARLRHIGPVVVAGGAVRDSLMGVEPKDYDVFVLQAVPDSANPQKVKDAVKALPVVQTLEWHRSEPYLVVTVRWHDVDVQIMLNPAADVEALLDTFDWNVCLFAFDLKYHVRTPLEEIAPGKELKLQKLTFPVSTLRRGFRFSERFLMQLPRETVNEICQAVVEKKDVPVGPDGQLPDMPSLAKNALVDDNE